jgi:hypothetical protein
MFTALAISVVVLLVATAYWLYGRLDSMLSKVEGKVRPYVPGVKEKFTAAAQYARPRATGWARRLALGCVAHVAVALGAATCVALVRPAPQEVTYASIAKREDATWFQHSMAYVGYGTGWVVDEVNPGFLYSTARLNDGTVLVGLPGVQRWYRL